VIVTERKGRLLDVPETCRALEACGMRIVMDAIVHGGREVTLAHDRGVVVLDASTGRWAHHAIATNDTGLHEQIDRALASGCAVAVGPAGPIHALAKTEEGYKLVEVGRCGVPLERGNYVPDVLAAYDHVVADLKVPTPCGRLSVLQGEPGSGKSYLVRALLVEGVAATFVLVPPHLLGGLGDPDFLPSIIQARDECDSAARGPLVLICEDGDMCLVPRMGDNMSTVQSVLNLGDGLLGSLLDVRVLITTNAPEIKMDKAVVRKGRLCRRVNVGRLSAVQATSVLRRLVPDVKEEFTALATLSDVYDGARERGWHPPADGGSR
jgi:hypothetical protein